MNKKDQALAARLRNDLRAYSAKVRNLPGISGKAEEEALIRQIIDSIRRIRFIDEIKVRPISAMRGDPSSDLFDPIRAAILKTQTGEIDEAAWFIFLFTHFGKNLRSGYRLARDFYGKLGQGGTWDWTSTSGDVEGVRHWLDKNQAGLKSGVVHRAFGNHRKYQSLDAWKPNGTGECIQSYVAWVRAAGDHRSLFATAIEASSENPETAFGLLFADMKRVNSFGRMARFDYLSMIGKVGIAPIRPNSVHFSGATGPVTGAKLLFYGSETADVSTKALEQTADQLAQTLGLDKQVVEDSLCNWQKSTAHFIRFHG